MQQTSYYTGFLVPHSRYWHSSAARGLYVTTVPISAVWHSSPCNNYYLQNVWLRNLIFHQFAKVFSLESLLLYVIISVLVLIGYFSGLLKLMKPLFSNTKPGKAMEYIKKVALDLIKARRESGHTEKVC